jgi:hypothetical protein
MDSQQYESINIYYLKEIKTYLQDLNLDQVSLAQAISRSRKHLNFIRSEIKSKGFKSVEQEIHFFKHIKPLPLSHLIYFLKVQKLGYRSPVLLQEEKRKYLFRKMDSINRFHKKHAAFIQYLKQEQTHLDSVYFTRIHGNNSSGKYAFISDPEFSTSHDYLLAKYHPYLLFGRYLTYQLELLEHEGSHGQPLRERLRWTGQKVDLIELIYALHCSGVFDHGNSSVKKIADAFQELFQCPLGDYYRSYSELRYRKKSRIKFLDRLSVQLQKKMDADDA